MLPAPKLHVATSHCKLLIWETPCQSDGRASAKEQTSPPGPEVLEAPQKHPSVAAEQIQGTAALAPCSMTECTDEDHPSQALVALRIMQQDSDKQGGGANNFAIRRSKISLGEHVRVSGWQTACCKYSPVSSALRPRKQWDLYFKVPR